MTHYAILFTYMLIHICVRISVVPKWVAGMGLQFRTLGHSASAWGPDSETASCNLFSCSLVCSVAV